MEFFTEEEKKKASERTDLEGIKTKSLKLNMDNEEDKLLYLYLEDKSFTDVIKSAIKIYKKHFDPTVLQRRELARLEAVQTLPDKVVNQELQTTKIDVKNEVESVVENDMSEF